MIPLTATTSKANWIAYSFLISVQQNVIGSDNWALRVEVAGALMGRDELKEELGETHGSRPIPLLQK